jgi:hypothetical protein
MLGFSYSMRLDDFHRRGANHSPFERFFTLTETATSLRRD